MPPPRICPQPGPRQPGPDCPLYAQRLDYGTDEPLRRAILTERPKARSIAELVWADFNRAYQRPTSPPTRPAPPALPSAPQSLPVLDHLKQKGATNG